MNPRITLIVGTLLLLSLFVGPSLGSEERLEPWDAPAAFEPGDERHRADVQECLAAAEVDPLIQCTALYPQITDAWTIHPMTIQRPPECLAESPTPGLQPPGAQPTWGLARYSFFYMPGFIQYHESGCERGATPVPAGWLNSDIHLVEDAPLVGYWHLAVEQIEPVELGSIESTLGTSDAPEQLPCVTVRMVLETGRDRGEGSVIAQGQTTKNLITDHVQADQAPCPDAQGFASFDNVTQFRVALDEPRKAIPQFDSFVLHVQWFFHEPGASKNPADEDYLAPQKWRLHTDHEQPNRVVLPTKQSLQMAPLALESDDTRLHVTTDIRSTFGVHDLDPDAVRLQILDEQGTPVEVDGLEQPAYAVTSTTQAINTTVSWQLMQEALEPGNYTLRVSAANWQHTTIVAQESSFTIGPDQDLVLPEDNRTAAAVQGIGPGFNPMPLFALSLVGFIVAAVMSLGVTRRLQR